MCGSWASSISIVRALVGSAGSEVGTCVLIRCPADGSAPPGLCIGPEKQGRNGGAILDSLALSPGFPFSCSDLYRGELLSGLPCGGWDLL